MNRDYAVVLDACVLVGGGLRDTLLRLAEHPRLYIPKWSDDIIEEVLRCLRGPRFQLSVGQAEHLKSQLRIAFPEAWVTNYRVLEGGLGNHAKDRHVLAAAIRCGAQAIITFNLRDFPAEFLYPFDIEAVHPDEFLVNQFYLDDALVTKKFVEQAAAINRSVEEQLAAFHATAALPAFTQTMADALSIPL